MKTDLNIGIVSYGACIPRLAISIEEIEIAQGKNPGTVGPALGVLQKTVPAVDEDSITLATEATFQALQRLSAPVLSNSEKKRPKDSQKLNKNSSKNTKNVSIGDMSSCGALFVGSESHPYAVKPSGTVVAEALGLPRNMALADLQFACKAGTQALQIGAAYLVSGMAEKAIGIGADTAQAAPSDALEFTAGAGAASFVLGKEDSTQNLLARLLATTSFVSDTPDFWRRPREMFPQHGGRFTGKPAYFAHIEAATRDLLHKTGITVSDVDYCVFHTPNAKFPKTVAEKLGFSREQLRHSLVVEHIGNTYAAASLLALVNVLDTVEANKKILVTSYGSGAGADSFLFETTPHLVEQRRSWKNLLQDQINLLQQISYQEYRRNTSQH